MPAMGWVTSGYQLLLLAVEPSSGGSGEMPLFHGFVPAMLLGLLVLAVWFVILWRRQNTVRENHRQVAERQQRQIIELLDMINDNANLNTDYLLKALKTKGEASRSSNRLSQPVDIPIQCDPGLVKTKGEASGTNFEISQPVDADIETDAASAKSKPSSPVGQSGGGGDLTEARRLLETREADHPAHLQKCREMLLPELAGARRSEAAILLSETLFWLGEYSTSKKEKEKYHMEGVEYGKRSVELDEGQVASYLWYAANMGSHGMARGIMSSLFYIKDIEKAGNRALALDETFFHGAPLRLMGRFYHQCPPWPVGKGDLKKAIFLLEKAVAAGPDFLLNHLYLAEVYLAKRKKAQAKDVLAGILQNRPKIFPVYQTRIQAQAQELIKKF